MQILKTELPKNYQNQNTTNQTTKLTSKQSPNIYTNCHSPNQLLLHIQTSTSIQINIHHSIQKSITPIYPNSILNHQTSTTTTT